MAPSLTWHRVASGNHRPVILFVHHVGGSQNTVRRHVQLVNELGFDAVSFNLSHHGKNPRRVLHFDFYFQWTKEIKAVADSLKRPMIVYAFSRPSTCALRYIVEGKKSGNSNVIGFIGDSGPFIVPPSDVRNMLTKIMAIEGKWLRRLVFLPMMLTWDRFFQSDIKNDMKALAKLEPDFPILSIRGLKDTLVPPHQIELAFAGTYFRNLKILNLPLGAHLNGLRDFATEYRATLEAFLQPFLKKS